MENRWLVKNSNVKTYKNIDKDIKKENNRSQRKMVRSWMYRYIAITGKTWH